MDHWLVHRKSTNTVSIARLSNAGRVHERAHAKPGQLLRETSMLLAHRGHVCTIYWRLHNGTLIRPHPLIHLPSFLQYRSSFSLTHSLIPSSVSHLRAWRPIKYTRVPGEVSKGRCARSGYIPPLQAWWKPSNPISCNG